MVVFDTGRERELKTMAAFVGEMALRHYWLYIAGIGQLR